MLQELEQIAIKYKKIAEYALDLKKQNTILASQIENIKHTMESLIDDKINLEHQNGLLNLQLTQIKTNLENILTNTDWECGVSDTRLNNHIHIIDTIEIEPEPETKSINSAPTLEDTKNSQEIEDNKEETIPYFAINPSLGSFISDIQNSNNTANSSNFNPNTNTQGKLIFNNEQEILINHKM